MIESNLTFMDWVILLICFALIWWQIQVLKSVKFVTPNIEEKNEKNKL